MDSQFEALAAWIDGEPVSRTDVAAALELPEGRDYVLDLMALRGMVSVTTPVLAAQSRQGTPSRWRLFAAAAAVVLCSAGGFVAGRLAAPQPAMPEAQEVVAAPTVTPASISAPEPTRVIRLDEGTTWRESGGS